ncbi:MAG: hypothetical protein COV46_05780 [Deltaproteobacteria bacterium CG11_big_fil_rev_8_21_14_0_20_49_13]|nr:MAG: hypothetical protein COV46_05780 [Deltaproteobacteria bacterium CG11_big_fil_rev_8_21_14_0_20_49_13]
MTTKLGSTNELTIPKEHMKEFRELFCTTDTSVAVELIKNLANATRPKDKDEDPFSEIMAVAVDEEMNFCKMGSVGGSMSDPAATEYTLGRGWGTVFKALLTTPTTSTTGTGQLCDRITSRVNSLLFFHDFPQKLSWRLNGQYKRFMGEESLKKPEERRWTAENESRFQQRLQECVDTFKPVNLGTTEEPEFMLNKYPIDNGVIAYVDPREVCKEVYDMVKTKDVDISTVGSSSESRPWWMKDEEKPAHPMDAFFKAALRGIPWDAWVSYNDFCTPISKLESVMSPLRYATYLLMTGLGYIGRNLIRGVVIYTVRLVVDIVTIPLGGLRKRIKDVFRKGPPTGTPPVNGAPGEAPAPAPDGGAKRVMIEYDLEENGPRFPVPAPVTTEELVPVVTIVGLAYLLAQTAQRLAPYAIRVNPAVGLLPVNEQFINDLGNSVDCGIFESTDPKCDTWRYEQSARDRL